MTLNIGRRWSKPQHQPVKPVPINGPVPTNAVIPTWNEADVIAATVANLFVQGCDRVFVVDNGSLDDTTTEARKAGAEIACVYKTDFKDEWRKLSEIKQVINRISVESNASHLWWLVSDADEFHHGPQGLTVTEYLETLDRRFRVVGARCFNHFPSGWPAYVKGRHPIDHQPLCDEIKLPWCPLRHWKHPLIRWDREGTPVWPGPGHHRAESPNRILEPTQAIYLHHFPFRDREVTTRRLNMLFASGPDGGRGRASATEEAEPKRTLDGRLRYEMLEHVYANEWAYVARPAVGRQKHGVHPRPWEQQVPTADALLARWYTIAE